MPGEVSSHGPLHHEFDHDMFVPCKHFSRDQTLSEFPLVALPLPLPQEPNAGQGSGEVEVSIQTMYSHNMSLEVSLNKSVRVLGGWTSWNDPVPLADLYFPLNLGVFVLACS